MRFCEKRQPPVTKNFFKRRKNDEDLQIHHHSYDRPAWHFCGRNLGQALAPDTFLYPTACFGLALTVWGSDYETAFRNDRWFVILKWHSDLFQINQRRNCRFEMMAPVSSKWWMDFLFEMKIWLPFRYDDKGFFSLCLLSKRQSFFLSYEKDRFSANDRHFRKDSFSLQTIETLSFQKDRLPPQEKVLILI